jgi:hypothetical protein
VTELTHDLEKRKMIGKKSDVIFASLMIGMSFGGIIGSFTDGSLALIGAVVGATIGWFISNK